MVYLTTLGCFRAVAELASVGFEGGALSLRLNQKIQSWFYTRDHHFLCEISRSSHGQLQLWIYSTSIYEALDLEMSYKVLSVHLALWMRCMQVERAPTR